MCSCSLPFIFFNPSRSDDIVNEMLLYCNVFTSFVGSISSRCSGNEPTLLPRTRERERATEIEPTSFVNV